MGSVTNDDKTNRFKVIIIAVVVLLIFYLIGSFNKNKSIINTLNGNDFRIIASTSTRSMESDLKKFGRKQGINIDIDYYGDLEIVDILNDDSSNYDAVWISNSIWLYMLSNSYLVTDSKSILIDPVVMGIKKSRAEELGLTNGNIYNKDLLNAIREQKLKYVMASVTKTNTGATTYLSFLNSLAGNPEVLTEDILDDEKLVNDLKDFFKGVERVSGDEEYLEEMYLNGEYDAMIDYESSLINLNQKLVKNKKEPLYLVYPVDGVAINDMPFGYISNDVNDTNKKERFKLIQSYLRSDEAIEKMEDLGYRSWYGGIKVDTDEKTFNKEWGIDTSKYLSDMKYPSKSVITKAINLYINAIRKPTHVVFCLDTSGSMSGSGLQELNDAMSYILDPSKSGKDNLQFSDGDKISVITFNHNVDEVFETRYGNDTSLLVSEISNLKANGGTNIYSPSIKALKILKDENTNEFTRTVILMTDGQSNNGTYSELETYYNKNKLDIPIYSITFGDSSERELLGIADLTNAKVFDGKTDLLRAFREVRSYN